MDGGIASMPSPSPLPSLNAVDVGHDRVVNLLDHAVPLRTSRAPRPMLKAFAPPARPGSVVYSFDFLLRPGPKGVVSERARAFGRCVPSTWGLASAAHHERLRNETTGASKQESTWMEERQGSARCPQLTIHPVTGRVFVARQVSRRTQPLLLCYSCAF